MAQVNFGQFLVFQLKYWPEMKQLYWDRREPDELELDDPEDTKQRVLEVGDKGKQEAVKLLGTCGLEILNHFKEEGDCRPLTNRGIEENWSISYQIKLKGKVWTKTAHLKAGLDIQKESSELVAWFSRRETKGSEAAMGHLKGKCKFPDAEVQDNTRVILGKRKIFSPQQAGFDLELEALVSFVNEAFSVITAHDLSLVFPK